MMRVIHTIPPVYDEHSRILMLGTIPSPKSREVGFYYGHPQNRFWRIICDLLEEPYVFSPEERRGVALRRGIALWDVLASCEISGAEDASIREEKPNDLSRILSCAPIRAIFTTGAKATKLYEKYCFHQTGRGCIALPSTSPANCRMSCDQLKEAYRFILEYLL